MTRDDAALIGAITVVGLTSFLLVVLYGWSANTAAWVQAIGTIFAVVASIIIASRQSREAARLVRQERQRHDAESRKSAYLLMLRLSSLLWDLEIKLGTVGTVVERLPNLAPQIEEDVDSVLDALRLGITWEEEIFFELKLLPTKAARYSGHVLYSAARFDRETPVAIVFTQKHPGGLETLAEKLHTNVQNMKSDLDLAREALRPLLDARPDDA
jgi:hypothetical protein